MRNFYIILFFVFYLSGTTYGYDLSEIETLYKNGKYDLYISKIKNALKESPALKDDITLNAKIAFALSKINRYDESEAVWRKLTKKTDCRIVDYFWWYRGLNILNKGDTLEALAIWRESLSVIPGYTLEARIKFSYGEFSAVTGNYGDAVNIFLDLIEKKQYAGYSKPFIWNLVIKYALRAGRRKLAEKYFYKLSSNFPGSEYSLYWAEEFKFFSRAKSGTSEEKKRAVKILMGNGKNGDALKYMSALGNKVLKSTFLFYRAEIYFRQRKYSSAYRLYSKLNPEEFKTETRRQIYRQRGRCLYRLKRRKEAYAKFEILARKFPRWRKSLDLLWVAAMDYEKTKKFRDAVKWYKKIIAINPNHETVWKARFRIAFIDYQQKRYAKAIEGFKKIADSKIWYLWRDRAHFWLGKSLEAMRRFDEALDIYHDLADHSIADYYTMKSYLIIYRLGIEPAWQLPDYPTRSALNLDSYFDRHLKEFLPVLRVKDIFGREEAKEMASSMPVNMNRGLSYYLALIYLNREIGNFGLAYRYQVRIVNQYFSDMPYHLDSPITKFLFPLFYDDEVHRIAGNYDINPEFVFAVMRQESAFIADATSRVGAKGLLQLMPGTARELHSQFFRIPWDEERLTDIEYNIKLGTIYLSRLKRRFNDNYYYTLAAYNAGAHRVKRWINEISTKDVDIFLESITFNETRNYVRACMRNYWVYQIMLGIPPTDVAENISEFHPILEEKSEW